MINKEAVKEYLENGNTQREAAVKFRTTYQNISLIAKKLKLTHSDYGFGLKKKKRREKQTEGWVSKYGRNTWNIDDLTRAQHARFVRKRQNIKQTKKHEFTIDLKDMVWPTHCPVLGIELDYFAESRSENSASFDRTDSTKGYVKGNVQIISWRANRIKNDGTLEEHLKIVEYLTKTK